MKLFQVKKALSRNPEVLIAYEDPSNWIVDIGVAPKRGVYEGSRENEKYLQNFLDNLIPNSTHKTSRIVMFHKQKYYSPGELYFEDRYATEKSITKCIATPNDEDAKEFLLARGYKREGSFLIDESVSEHKLIITTHLVLWPSIEAAKYVWEKYGGMIIGGVLNLEEVNF